MYCELTLPARDISLPVSSVPVMRKGGNPSFLVYQNQVTYGKSFADVRIGQPIIYINSLYRVGLAINQGSFAKAYNVGVGSNWHIEIKHLGD